MQLSRIGAWVILLLVVCAGPSQTQEKKPVVFETNWYPLKVGSQWTYKVTSGNAPDAPVQKVQVTVDQQEVYDFKSTRDKKEIIEPIVRYKLKVVSGNKDPLYEYVAVLNDGVYRFTSAGKDIAPPLRFLKLPNTQGEKWTVNSVSENVQLVGTFVCEDDTVKVPAGQFQTKRVSTKDFQLGTEKMSLDHWFAPNVGIVQQRVHVGNNDILLELESFKEGK
jgi:hypothetical protein